MPPLKFIRGQEDNIALVSEYHEPLSGSYSEYETSPLPQDEHFEDNSSLDSI